MRRKKEAGEYECVAENGNGDPVTATAELTVFEGNSHCHSNYYHHGHHQITLNNILTNYILPQEKSLPDGFPQIIQNPAMKVVEKARHAVLVCEASGTPKPTITWIKDTMPIDLKANPRLSLMKQGKLRGKAG